MKKFIAATLLTIYLFNIGGQLAMHRYFSYLSDRFFNEQTSKGLYNIDDLTEVVIPTNMPGIADWKNYENVSGQIQFENVNYNYVKMKITRNAIYLMCVPNYKTTKLYSGNIINARGVKNAPVPQKNHVPYGKIILLGKVDLAFTQFAFTTFGKTLQQPPVPAEQRLACHYPAIPEQPPRLAC